MYVFIHYVLHWNTENTEIPVYRFIPVTIAQYRRGPYYNTFIVIIHYRINFSSPLPQHIVKNIFIIHAIFVRFSVWYSVISLRCTLYIPYTRICTLPTFAAADAKHASRRSVAPSLLPSLPPHPWNGQFRTISQYCTTCYRSDGHTSCR